nr:hypothetical protein [Tanacetum cinerariifolium]
MKSHQAIKVEFFSLSNSLEAFNVDNSINEEVATCTKATTLEKQILKGKLVLMDDKRKPLENVDYLVNSDSDDVVEPIENETAKFLASERVVYGPKSLWEQCRETAMDDEYEPYDDMYKDQEILKTYKLYVILLTLRFSEFFALFIALRFQKITQENW